MFLERIGYKAMVNIDEETKQIIISLTENKFKQRYFSHLQSMRHENYESSTKLSKYVQRMKRSSKDDNIKWSIRKRASAYSQPHPLPGNPVLSQSSAKSRIIKVCCTTHIHVFRIRDPKTACRFPVANTQMCV